MHSITIKLDDDIVVQLDMLAQQYIEDYAKLRKGRPPLTHAEWLARHQNGKQFMHDCMSHKYIKLTQTELTRLSTKLYYETFNMTPRYGQMTTSILSLRDARSAVIAEVIQRAAQINEKPVLKIIPKNK